MTDDLDARIRARIDELELHVGCAECGGREAQRLADALRAVLDLCVAPDTLAEARGGYVLIPNLARAIADALGLANGMGET